MSLRNDSKYRNIRKVNTWSIKVKYLYDEYESKYILLP